MREEFPVDFFKRVFVDDAVWTFLEKKSKLFNYPN